MLEFLLRPTIAIPVLFFSFYVVYSLLSSKPNLPDVPWVGIRNESFAKIRCRWRTTLNYLPSAQDAYNNFLLKGRACILPSLPRDLVLLPTASTEWIINQPDEVLGVKQVHEEILQSDYTLGNPAIAREPYHEDIIRTDLVRQLGNLTMDIMDELTIGFDETWGLDTQNWNSIGVFDNMMAIIARTSNRIFVGLPLCRNESYLSLTKNFTTNIIIGASVLTLFPKALRPVLAPLITLPNKLHANKLFKHLEPVIQSRLLDLDPEKDESRPKFNDFLQWSIDNARTKLSHIPREMTPRLLAGRLNVVNFAAIHTSTISITNTILELVSSDPSLHYLDEMREEAAAVLAENDGIWTKKGLAKMYKIDSAIREALRISSFISDGMVRKVVAKDGVTTPDGLHIPCGAHVAVSAVGIHNDEKYYTKPATYDAFRYVRQRESIDRAEQGADNDYLKKANFGLVSTSAEFQPFGHGRHACPGRFFAANELKLLLAYMVLNYDIEPLSEKPEGTWIATFAVPATKATIRVRRRKVE